jgi:hypothetical protein
MSKINRYSLSQTSEVLLFPFPLTLYPIKTKVYLTSTRNAIVSRQDKCERQSFPVLSER